MWLDKALSWIIAIMLLILALILSITFGWLYSVTEIMEIGMMGACCCILIILILYVMGNGMIDYESFNDQKKLELMQRPDVVCVVCNNRILIYMSNLYVGQIDYIGRDGIFENETHYFFGALKAFKESCYKPYWKEDSNEEDPPYSLNISELKRFGT